MRFGRDSRGLLGGWQQRTLRITIPYVLGQLESGPAQENLIRLLKPSDKPFTGMVFTDSGIYKTLEAVAWASIALEPADDRLRRAIMLFPIYWMVNVSFTQTRDMRRDPPPLFPVNGTLDGYRAVLHQQLPFLGTSLVIGLGTVLLTLILAAPAGYSLAQLRPRGGSALSFALLMAQMIPGIIMAIGFYAIYLSLGVLNTLPGLILADSTIAVPFGVLMFTAFMRGLPNELMQAATIDGAGSIRTFRSIVLPLSRNAVVTVSLFAFLWSWSDFIFASTVDGGGNRQPITIGIYHYIGNNNQEWNSIMATAVVASIPTAVLLVLAQRYVAAGVTSGAVKD